MPYINWGDRDRFIPLLKELQLAHPSTAGELNYLVTKIFQKFLEHHGESYGTYNSIVGAIECAKLELYRRLIGNYEDTKKQLNGDVY